jgi:hypothetical protein
VLNPHLAESPNWFGNLSRSRDSSCAAFTSASRRRTVKFADAGHALAVLTTHLKGNSDRHTAAVAACQKALRGELYPPIARRLFVSAALEAHVLIAD